MRVFATVFLAVLIGMGCSVWAQELRSEASAAPATSISYRFENPAFLLSPVEMSLDVKGDGMLNFTRKGLAQPVERQMRIEAETVRRIDELVNESGFFTSPAEYQSSSHQFPNMGTVWITAMRRDSKRTVSFNYTENASMTELASLLRGLATREVHAFDLEISIRHSPLALPGILGQIEADLKNKRIAEPSGLLPLLVQMSDDPTLPLIARNRAGKLGKAIEAKSKASSDASSDRRP